MNTTAEDFSEVRTLRPSASKLMAAFCLLFALYHFITAGFGLPVNHMHMAIHLSGIILMALCYYPASRRRVTRGVPSRVPVHDIALILVGIAAAFYLPLFWRGGTIGFGDFSYTVAAQTLRQGNPNELDLFLGTFLILLTVEMSRRTLGWALPIISILAMSYALFGPYIPVAILQHPGVDWRQFVNNVYFPSEGIFGTPLWVVSTIVIQFVIFGVLAQATGLGEFFIATAKAIAGRQLGGPAKVSVVASALFGSISGSSIANTVSTGTLTIPNMKRLGYPGTFAAAVEAAASSGGQIMPPLMGAAAFIMAEFLQVPYTTVVIAAIFPALMHFLGVYAQVHFTAQRLGLAADTTGKLTDVLVVWRTGWRHVFPLAALLAVLFSGYTPYMAAFVGISAAALYGFTSVARPATLVLNALFIAFVAMKALDGSFSPAISVFLISMAFVAAARKDEPLPIATLVHCLVTGAKYSLIVGVAAAVVGITIGVVNTTGIGFRLGFMVTSGAAQMAETLSALVPLLPVPSLQLFLSLVLVAICCIVMGAGLPTTALYILLATVAQPALSMLGVPPIASHMFVFYYGLIAELTPPVCTTAFAAAAIAQSPPFKTGVQAFKLGIGKLVVPMVFCYSPSLLLVVDDFSLRAFLEDGITCVIGVIIMSAALSRYMGGPLSVPVAVMVFMAGMLVSATGYVSDLVGVGILVAVEGYRFFIQKEGVFVRARH